MINPMQAFQMLSQFQQFATQIKNSKQDPQALLDNLVQSGKVNQQQLQQATEMAKMFKSILGGK